MSYMATAWASMSAPIADVNEFAVLMMLAEKAGADGCGAFPARKTIADRTCIAPRTVLRALQRMEERRLIAQGDQRAAEYIRADRRPVVYDLLIPAAWYSAQQLADVNEERQQHGLPPLTPKNRPEIAPAPGKNTRSDVGKAAPQRRRKTQRGVSETPCEGGVRGVSETDTGCLEDTHGVSQRHPREVLDPVLEPLSQADAADAAAPAVGADAETGERENGAARGTTPHLPPQRTGQVPENTGDAIAAALAAQWRTAHGTAPGRRQLVQITADAADAIADGDTPEWLLGSVVPFMVARRYLDLGRARTHRDCPAPAAAREPAKSQCLAGECDGSGVLYRPEDVLQESPIRCACRKARATA
ncbi:helix-turn-helix domain-containing protein [Streptomyces sp. NPDC058045]|uniref:helix-turn-helix domain-containing protein n=1 Tax=Streptomyces sp. NPDC058045 TaxID=3346311 RepID=UPI0036F0299A